MSAMDPASIVIMFASALLGMVAAGALGFFSFGNSYKASFFIQLIYFCVMVILLPGIFGVV